MEMTDEEIKRELYNIILDWQEETGNEYPYINILQSERKRLAKNICKFIKSKILGGGE
jgi:hypothetical protein